MESNGEGLAAMVCDLETGICGPAGTSENGADPGAGGAAPSTDSATSAAGSTAPGTDSVAPKLRQLRPPVKKVDLYYVTDPICSHCWALEPVLRRFEHEYRRHLDVRVVMGGLLPGWDGFADRANGIGQPADVAHHWREVGVASRMPIDGSVWLRDPIASSYPPSRVYVVLRERDPELARRFLRRAREAVFAFDRNIADPEVLAELVNDLGHPELDGAAIVAEADSERGRSLLSEDIALARELGVRGFPTILLVNETGEGVKVTGVRPLEAYVDALSQVLGEGAEVRRSDVAPLDELLGSEGRLFAKEIEAYYDIAPEAVNAFVTERSTDGALRAGEVLGEAYWEQEKVSQVTGKGGNK